MEASSRVVGRVIVIAAVVVAIACSWLTSIQTLAEEQVSNGFKRATATYVVAKALNATISFAQGTEVAAQPLGIGVTVTPGQLLDPLNDLVEQFADLMLTAAVAFGIQKMLLMMGAHGVISLAVTAVAVAWAALYFQDRAPQWLSRLLVVLVMVRFAIPVMTIGSDWAFQVFLANKYETAQASLRVVAGDAKKSSAEFTETGKKEVSSAAEPSNRQVSTAGEEGAKDAGLWGGLFKMGKSLLGGNAEKVAAPVEAQNDKAEGWVDALKRKFTGLDAKLSALSDSVDRATEHIIDLMVVFLLQTLVVPLVLLWGLLKAAGVAFSTPARRAQMGEAA